MPATAVAGTVLTDTTWVAGASPYLLTESVLVAPTVTLRIEPGVVVMARHGVKLRVQGHLEALGNFARPITFTSAEDSAPNQWSGLLFEAALGTCAMRLCGTPV